MPKINNAHLVGDNYEAIFDADEEQVKQEHPVLEVLFFFFASIII